MENYKLHPSLRPALAGLVIDHEAGEKEAYAAFADLVARGHVSPVMSGGKNAFAITRSGEGDLFEHEKAVLEAVFRSKKAPVGYGDAAQALSMLGTAEAFQSALAKDAVAQGLYVERKTPMNLSTFNAALSEKYGKRFRAVFLAFAACFAVLVALTVVAMPVFFFLSIFYHSIFEAFIVGAGVCLPVPHLLFFISMAYLMHKCYLERSEFERKFLPELSTSVGSAQRAKYADLRDWLFENPLREMRWSNEFLGYSIAFGLVENYREFPK
ncbi:MAG: hypothetical protein WC263_01390 [Candidatus Micrarchaeia archaeon]|jgi:hypothetical protein